MKIELELTTTISDKSDVLSKITQLVKNAEQLGFKLEELELEAGEMEKEKEKEKEEEEEN
ncbi:MAG: hypothetical protein QXU32_07685 [Nitrososphaerales archaeon]